MATVTPTQQQLDMFKNMTPEQQANFLTTNPSMKAVFTKQQTDTTIAPEPLQQGATINGTDLSKVTMKNADAQLKAGNITQEQYNNIKSGTNYQPVVSTTAKPVSETMGTGVSQQETTTKTTATTQNANEPSKTDTSATRLAEIQNNLTTYAQTQPQLFNDINAYKSFFGYDQRAKEQQNVLDTFFNTQQGVIAKQKADQERYNTLSTMSPMDLMGVTDVNDISLINQDPVLQAKYQQAQNNRQMLEFVYGKDYGKAPTPQIDGLDGLPDNIQTEIGAANAELIKTKNEMDKIQDTMDSTYNDLAKQYEGTGTTDAYIRAKAAKLNSELTDQYNDLTRKYNSQLGTVSSLASMVQAQKEEEASKRQDWALKLDMFNSMFGTTKTQATEIPVQTKDFGTTKKPNWMQSLDGGKTRQPIQGITATGGVGGGSVGLSTLDTSPIMTTKAKDMLTRYTRLRNAIQNASPLLPLSSVLALPENYSDLKYIEDNLSLLSFREAKAAGVSFGAMTNPEWDILKRSNISINPYAGKQYNLNELDRLSGNLGGQSTQIQTTPQNSTIANIMSKRNIGTPTIQQTIQKPAPTVKKTKKRYEGLGQAIRDRAF